MMKTNPPAGPASTYTLTVKHSPGSMKASIAVLDAVAPLYPSVRELRSTLLSHGIIEGLDEKALETMVARKIVNEHIDVAHGFLPVPGAPGRLEFLVDLSNAGKPRELEGGKVDHRDLQTVVNVRAGAPLVRRIPPMRGTDGKNVFGKILFAGVPKDAKLPKGKGTRISPDDPDLLVAEIDGAIVLLETGNLEVRTTYSVSGDIDYSTGNIIYAGDLRVHGAVRAGFEVKAEGTIVIEKDVEDARCIASGGIEIAGGAAGARSGLLHAGGNISARFIENFAVETAKDVIVAEDIITCDVKAEGSVKAKRAIGGSVFAMKSIEIGSIGSEAEVKTVLQVGGLPVLVQQKYGLLKEMKQATEELGSIKERMFLFVRDSMDAAGNLNEEASRDLGNMKKQKCEFSRHLRELQVTIDGLDQRIQALPDPFMKLRRVFPGTVIKIGSLEKVVREELTNVCITASGDRLEFGKL